MAITNQTNAQADVCHVQIDLPSEVYERACELASRERWPEPEVWLTLISYGLAYLEGERELSRLNRGDPDLRAEVERFHAQAMQLDSAYSVMKFRAFELAKLVKVLEMNIAGLRGENELAKHRLAMFRADEQRLKAEMAVLRAQVASIPTENERAPRVSDQPESSAHGLVSWLRRWLGPRSLGAAVHSRIQRPDQT
ncbi:MAG TPA: hypothetical protein VFC51_11860 [Chloroflexota bacterium]|nr:hypothetical protein [Chloroflexota bacterium]